MRVEALRLESIPPFADQTILFPLSGSREGGGEVQLITGENGTGKTRMLCVLAAAFGNESDLTSRIGTSLDACKAKVLAEANGSKLYWNWRPRRCGYLPKSKQDPDVLTRQHNEIQLGEARKHLTETSGSEPPRTALAFRGTGRASDAKVAAMQPVDLGKPLSHLSFEPAANEDALVCQSMANLKMGAAMEYLSKGDRKSGRALKTVERLETTVSQITGRDFSFDVTAHPEVRLRVYWGQVEMQIGQLPDGLRSIIGWLVSCIAKLESQFPDSSAPLDIPLVLLLDEPESHLHPAWQRKLLPAAQALLPNAQIFVATHSPFVISSVNSGWIHVLRARANGTVKADKPIQCSEGDTYLDVVEDILGVKEWYDPETEKLLAEFRELRGQVLKGAGEADKLNVLSESIAKRSESLRELMAREMSQVHRLIAQGAAKA